MNQSNNPRRLSVASKRRSAGNNAVHSSNERPRCEVIRKDHSVCYAFLSHPKDRFCHLHHQEYKELNRKYKEAEEHYNRIIEPDGGFGVKERQEKIEWVVKTVELRDQVNGRFFSCTERNRGHVRWILKLKEELKILESIKEESDHGIPPAPPNSSTNTQERETEQLVYQSYLSPEVPMSSLDHLPADDSTKVLKALINEMIGSCVPRLYAIVPSLNDSLPTIKRLEDNTRRETDKGDQILRFVLREYLVWKADAHTLFRAKRTASIHTFLRESSPSELADYIQFFETLGRVDTLHFLRDAICDYLLPPGGSSPMIILGAAVVTEDEHRTMTCEGWDILYCHFTNLVEWYNLEQFCVKFADFSLIKRLVALHRYG